MRRALCEHKLAFLWVTCQGVRSLGCMGVTRRGFEGCIWDGEAGRVGLCCRRAPVGRTGSGAHPETLGGLLHLSVNCY